MFESCVLFADPYSCYGMTLFAHGNIYLINNEPASILCKQKTFLAQIFTRLISEWMRTLIPGGLRQARAEYWVPIKHYDLNVVMRHYGTTCQHCLTLSRSLFFIQHIQQIILMIFANMSQPEIETLIHKLFLYQRQFVIGGDILWRSVPFLVKWRQLVQTLFIKDPCLDKESIV